MRKICPKFTKRWTQVICHRLQHISRFDTVFVLADGRIAEAGPPSRLLNDPTSRLAHLVRRAKNSASE